MAVSNHIYARTPDLNQFVLIYTDTFPDKSLLAGTDARKFCEIIYTPKAAKTGGGFGSVIIDEFGVPSIVGVAGEYTFTWYVNDKTDGLRYGPYTCTMTSTPFADVTAPTVAITTTGALLDLRPALVGTVNDATARVVVSISNKDYVATNDGVGGWSIPINTIDPIPIDVTTVTVRAIDNYDNIGSASTTIYYNGSQYAFVSDFDVSAQGYTDQQAISTLASLVGTSQLTSTNASFQPTYNAADQSLIFTASPTDRLYDTVVDSFREFFIVLTDTTTSNYSYIFQLATNTSSRTAFRTGGNTSQWYYNNLVVTGRIAGGKQIIHIRYEIDQAIISINGGTPQIKTYTGVINEDMSKIYMHDTNFSGTDMKLHEICTTASLNTAQRAAVIADLKTKWGII